MDPVALATGGDGARDLTIYSSCAAPHRVEQAPLPLAGQAPALQPLGPLPQ